MEKIKASQTILNNRRTFSDAELVLKKDELEKEERSTKNELKKYVIRYMKSIQILLADEFDERIRKIINKRDIHGNTPLHYAVNNWPQNIIKDMMKLGADLSIENKGNQIPLKRLPKATISNFLDEHCMVTDGFDALDDENYLDEATKDSEDEEKGDDDDRFYKELLEEYDPRFMTNIVQSPITFKYDLLSPTPYSNSVFSSQNKDEVKYATPSEMSVLSAICKSEKHRDLVTHPVIKSFVWIKWKLVSKCYNRNVRMNILLVYYLTWYIFRQFGGLEYNSKCIESNVFSNHGNLSEFCEKSREEYENLIQRHAYGELEMMTPIERWNFYLESFNTPAGKCMYTNEFYLVYLLISSILGGWMIKDTIRDFLPIKNTDKCGYLSQKKKFMSCIIPAGMDAVNLLLILSVLILSERVLWVVISVLFLSILLTEMLQLVMSPRTYFKKLSNWIDMGLLILIALVLYVPNHLMLDPLSFSLHSTVERICPKESNDSNSCQNDGPTHADVRNISLNDLNDVSVKRFLSSYLIVLSWTRFVFEIAKHPGKKTENLNKYAMMYGRVASSFFKLLICYSLFIIAFSFGFYISFHNDIGTARLEVPSLTNYVFFESPFESFIKTMAMFIGEVDFNNIPVGISYAKKDGNVSVLLGYVFVLTFIFMIIMVLMNLLNGLAVTDIVEIIKESETLHQISLINILADFEEMAFTYKKGLELISSFCTCLKQFLLTHLDISKELLLFPTVNKSDIRREKLFKRQKTLPFEDSSNDTLKSNKSGCVKNFIKNHLNEDENKGSEHILAEARDILIKAKKSRMDQRALRKKHEKDIEEAVEKTKLERQKTVALMKETVMDRLIPIVVENGNSMVHL